MPRTAEKINCEESVINQLKLIESNPFSSKALVNRARIILMSTEGIDNKTIAERLDTRPNTVSDVRKRFIQFGLDGLKDRDRSGRRGNDVDSPDEQILSYVSDHKEEELTISTICSALNIPDYTVRRVLHAHNIQLQRSTIWNVQTKDSVIGRYLQLSGIYISGSIMAAIVCAFGNECEALPNEGTVTTRDRLQAEALFSFSEEYHKEPSLADALRVASQKGQSNKRGIPFDSFMRKLVKDDEDRIERVEEYHAIVFQSDKMLNLPSEILQHKLVVHKTDSVDAWCIYVEKVLSVLEPLYGFSSPSKVIDALSSYMKNYMGNPFAWQLVRSEKRHHDENTKSQGDTHLAKINQEVEIHDGESILFMSGVLLQCTNGIISQQVVSQKTTVPSPEEFDFSSVQGYTQTVSKIDDAVTRTSKDLNKEIMKMCLNSPFKKNK